MGTVKTVLGWVATALVVTLATAMLPEREAQAEPITIATGVIFGSTIGSSLPVGLSGIGTGAGGAYAYAFATGGAVSVGAAVIAGVAIVGALAVGGYFLYKYIQEKREEKRLAIAGTNVRRDAITTANAGVDRRVGTGATSISGASGAGMHR